MMEENLSNLLNAMGFVQNTVLTPSEATRNLWVVRIRTTRGWLYLREKADADIVRAVEGWASKYEAA